MGLELGQTDPDLVRILDVAIGEGDLTAQAGQEVVDAVAITPDEALEEFGARRGESEFSVA